MGERLFSPKSLARVAEAVEWEDVLQVYKDGSTNQAEFMRALGILWERWMRGWSIPDFANAIQAVQAGRWVDQFERIVQTLENRVSQLVGFYQGLWAGANPGWGRFFGWQIPSVIPPVDEEERARKILESFLRFLVELQPFNGKEGEG